ncbi:hypothetical protein [Oleispirillum naphthae]|uniref:hypothetical protein n=1 Tax=Oleispirillum naphthae TaxID=2838853 RepID=UPI00308227A2
MSGLLPLALGAAASDILASYASPVTALGGAGLSAVVAKLLRKRLETAREILLEELRKGEKSLHDLEEVDELAAITFRYARAAQEGTARLNLRLMAKVIAGQAQAGPLVADEFLAWADVLASLRREEVIFIATLFSAERDTQQVRASSAGAEKLWEKVSQQLIPSIFPDEGWMRASACAAMRTGLVVDEPMFDGNGYFKVSPLMDKLQALAPFQEALHEEDNGIGEDHVHL